jgi:transposase
MVWGFGWRTPLPALKAELTWQEEKPACGRRLAIRACAQMQSARDLGSTDASSVESMDSWHQQGEHPWRADSIRSFKAASPFCSSLCNPALWHPWMGRGQSFAGGTEVIVIASFGTTRGVTMRQTIVDDLQFEVHRTKAGRYARRIHACLLREKGMECAEIARYLDESPAAIARWVRIFNAQGRAGLAEQNGRPRGLTRDQYWKICWDIERSHTGCVTGWTADAIAAWIKCDYGVTLSTTQCNRMLTDARHLRGIYL